MTTLIHADIFFFVTTILAIAIAVAFIIFLIYAIASVRMLFRISKSVETETNKIIDDVETLRKDLHKRHATIRARLMIFKRFFRKFFKL